MCTEAVDSGAFYSAWGNLQGVMLWKHTHYYNGEPVGEELDGVFGV